MCVVVHASGFAAILSKVRSSSSATRSGGSSCPKVFASSLDFRDPSGFDLLERGSIADAVLEHGGESGTLRVGEPHRGLEDALGFVAHAQQYGVAAKESDEISGSNCHRRHGDVSEILWMKASA